jgi:hypothetical protein
MDDKFIKLAVMHGRWKKAALSPGHRSRPQAFELINSQRAGLGRRGRLGAVKARIGIIA